MTPLLFIGGLGSSEVILILAVMLLFFGAKKIPDLARGLGKGIREFKDASAGIEEQINQAATTAPVKTEAAPEQAAA